MEKEDISQRNRFHISCPKRVAVVSSSYCELEDNASQRMRVCLRPRGEDLCSLSHLYGLPLTGGVPHSRRRVLPHSRPTWRAGMSSDNFSQLTSLCVPTLHLFLLLFLMSAVNCIALLSPNFNVKHMCFCKEQSRSRETHVRTRPQVCFPQAQCFGPHLLSFYEQNHKEIQLWIIILMTLFPC